MCYGLFFVVVFLVLLFLVVWVVRFNKLGGKLFIFFFLVNVRLKVLVVLRMLLENLLESFVNFSLMVLKFFCFFFFKFIFESFVFLIVVLIICFCFIFRFF